MNSTPLVSVIIPVYNVEAYLRECLDSIVNQTLENIEIICVNDGSTDNSLSILEEYRASDHRIIIVSQANGGLSAARNCGIRYAHGDFINFIDSDDYLDRTALEKTLSLAIKDNLDVVLFGVRAFYPSEEMQHTYSFETYYNKEGISGIHSGVEYLQKTKDKGTFITTVWRALWRHSLLTDNGILFKEGIIHEDNLFSFQALMAANRVLEIPDRFYHRRVRQDSIMTRPKSYKNVLGYFYCAMGVLEYAMSGKYEPSAEHEIWRAYTEFAARSAIDYHQLQEDERKKVVFYRELESELFKQAFLKEEYNRIKEEYDKVKGKNRRTEEEYNRMKEEYNRTKYDLDCVHGSVSFRIGRAITWLPRVIRNRVRCFFQHLEEKD